MFKHLRLRSTPPPPAPVEPIEHLLKAANTPIALRYLNDLPHEVKKRLYRGLLPPSLLKQFEVNPITWQGATDVEPVELLTTANKVYLEVKTGEAPAAGFLTLELQDNATNTIDLNLLVLNDPAMPYFPIDRDSDGATTHWGTVNRQLEAESQAMQAGLAPAQIRAGLRGSKLIFDQLEVFLSTLGHAAYFLEPLTYASAWVFEKRGFAYVRGHKLMDSIHREFQQGGVLFAALDGSTPFRHPQQAYSIRGRAWAIHDGILEVMGEHWNNLRMAKQIGRHAGVQTAQDTPY